MILWILTTAIAVATLRTSHRIAFHHRLLTWSGGLLVGLSLFWILPDIAENQGWPRSLAAVALGVLVLLLIDRWVYPVCPFCAFSADPSDCQVRSHDVQSGWQLLIAGSVHNFFDGWMVELARSGGTGGICQAISAGFALHKLPESVAVGALAGTFTSTIWGGFGAILVVQSAFALGAVAAPFSQGLNANIIDLCVAAAAATLLFFGLSALNAEWRSRGAAPALRAGMVGIGGCGIVALVLRFIGN